MTAFRSAVVVIVSLATFLSLGASIFMLDRIEAGDKVITPAYLASIQGMLMAIVLLLWEGLGK